jgi:hypothetical protein
MPLYTDVMLYRGVTKVSQIRRSDYTGFLLHPIDAAFPVLKPFYDHLMYRHPTPVHGAKRTWGFTTLLDGETFTLHVVETRPKPGGTSAAGNPITTFHLYRPTTGTNPRTTT